MKLGNAVYGPVFASSGTLNLDGSGWWYHRLLRFLGLDFRGATIITKTITAMPYVGNMPLRPDGKTPVERLPRCIYITLRTWLFGAVLNAVKFANPGVSFALKHGWWQHFTEPFLISFGVVPGLAMSPREQAEFFVWSLREHEKEFHAAYGIELDVHCPNVEHARDSSIVESTRELLEVLAALQVPIVVKCSVSMPTSSVKAIAAHSACAAVSVSNAVGWREFPGRIDWEMIFGTRTSPLAKRLGDGNPGALSGAPIAFLVREWIHYAMCEPIGKPIIGGGGILRKQDAQNLIDQGVAGIALGSIAMLRPWRVRGIIRFARRLFAQRRR